MSSFLIMLYAISFYSYRLKPVSKIMTLRIFLPIFCQNKITLVHRKENK